MNSPLAFFVYNIGQSVVAVRRGVVVVASDWFRGFVAPASRGNFVTVMVWVDVTIV